MNRGRDARVSALNTVGCLHRTNIEQTAAMSSVWREGQELGNPLETGADSK